MLVLHIMARWGLNQLFNIYVPTRPLRSENIMSIIIPKLNTRLGECDVAFRGCGYWNSLSYELKISTTINQLKQKLKPYGLEYI